MDHHVGQIVDAIAELGIESEYHCGLLQRQTDRKRCCPGAAGAPRGWFLFHAMEGSLRVPFIVRGRAGAEVG